MIQRSRAPVLLVLMAACGGGRSEAAAEAAAAFAAFQQALQQRDEATCRALLTVESAAALAEMPWQHVASQAPLEVVGAEPDHNQFRVRVRDPNDGDRVGEFVVVREYGRLVVDLVASAGRSAQVVEASAPREDFEPRELTPEDYERIRRFELSQPRR